MRSLVFWVFVLALPWSLFGQAKVGTAGAQFLEITPTARASGMGDIYLSISNDAEALYINPAGIAAFPKRSAIFSYIKYPADIMLAFAGISYPVARLGGVLGFSAVSLTMDDMPVRTPSHPDGNGQMFTASDYSASLTYARRLTDRFSVGITGKYVSEFYADEAAYGWAVDIGTLYITGFKNFRIGMCMSNFGPDMKFVKVRYPLPMNFKFSISSDLISSARNRITLGLYGSHPNDNIEKFAFGGEYVFMNQFAFRGSYKVNYDSELFTLGGGVNLPLSSFRFKFDYAFSKMRYLQDIHRFTLGIEF